MNIIFQNVSNKLPIKALYCKLSSIRCQARVIRMRRITETKWAIIVSLLQPSVHPSFLVAIIATLHLRVHVRVSVCLSKVLFLIVLIVLICIVDCVNRVKRVIRSTICLVAFFVYPSSYKTFCQWYQWIYHEVTDSHFPYRLFPPYQ